MKTTEVWQLPRRITDLIEQKEAGRAVTCLTRFEILPVDFLHRKYPYKAYVFLCRFSGEIDAQPYSFRKCYARGCPKNDCVHVSQAIMIANRYLQRDYDRLTKAEILVKKRLFTIEDMILKYDGYQQQQTTTVTLEDYIQMSEDGINVDVRIDLEYVPAVEHFANHKNSQTFLTVDFTVNAGDKKHTFQLCLACYQTDREQEEKTMQEGVANARLKTLYQVLAKSAVNYTEAFF